HRLRKDNIKHGDHIYTWRGCYAYSHQGIYVGGSKVIHFTGGSNRNLSFSSSSSYNLTSGIPSSCPTYPDCGFRLPNNGVTLSCLNCFLGTGSLFLYAYGVSKYAFMVKRGGTCTTAQSDPSETVIQRADHLLLNGFGNYDAIINNCEHFALYCKTGLQGKDGRGGSAQISSITCGPVAALVSLPFALVMPAVGVASVTAVLYNIIRCADDTGARTDTINVPVEELTR
ncbi:hypothetical protein KSS87_017506, partial [Heliosperma pusillum]